MIEKPQVMSEESRLSEVAKWLAAGVLRLRARTELRPRDEPPSAPESPPNSDSNGLELSDETVLSVHTG